jgi:hypothetical protein
MTESEQVIHDYLEALRKLYGNALADSSILYYKNGWYYISVAHKVPDGGYYASTVTEGKRKKQIVEMTNNLLSRVKA